MSECRQDEETGECDVATEVDVAPEPAACEDEQVSRRKWKPIDLWAEAQMSSQECLARLRGLCMTPPAPLAPPTARFHPVPTRPVFSPTCYDEPPAPPVAPGKEVGAEELPAPPGNASDQESGPPPIETDPPPAEEVAL